MTAGRDWSAYLWLTPGKSGGDLRYLLDLPRLMDLLFLR